MKFIDYKIKEISKVMAGGDKPKVCSDVYSDETPIQMVWRMRDYMVILMFQKLKEIR